MNLVDAGQLSNARESCIENGIITLSVKAKR